MGLSSKVNNKKLLRSARACLVGGVNSPVRSFSAVGQDSFIIKKGRGPYLYDHDGKRYIDYVLSWGAAIFGHAHSPIVKAVQDSARNGTHFGVTTCVEIELAQMIQGAISFVEKVRFVNSGTEAVMGAVRLARGFTGRDIILKFEHSYHGHADYLLAKAGSGLATLGIPASKGVPKDFTRKTLIAPAGDWEAVERIFQRHGKQIAAVLVEPVGGNYGVTPPDQEFLQKLRRITQRNGALLIFDEVITGFRFHYGAAADLFGVTPDLITLGKIIGGGLPVGAFAGPEKIMRHLAPLGQVYQASTFAGNPIVMAAGKATLRALKEKKKEYSRLSRYGNVLASTLKESLSRRKMNVSVVQHHSMLSVRFLDGRVFRKFYQGMFQQGIFLAPSEFEVNFISFAHQEKDIHRTQSAMERSIAAL